MILYIVRHGLAVDRTDPKAPAEAERPLTAKGVQKTRAAALGLAELKVKPDVLISSPFVRAAQTAEIFAETLGYSVNKIKASDALKPTANPADIMKVATRLRAKEVMVFGHAPHLDNLAAHLIGSRVFTELKKAGVACFEHTPATGKWNLRWLVTPKMLREIGD